MCKNNNILSKLPIVSLSFPWRSILLIVTASFVIWIVPKIYWDRLVMSQFDRLLSEARRAGGDASIPEGGYNLKRRWISIRLDLSSARISDEDVARFVAMPAFKYVIHLSLADTPVTDKCVQLLRDNQSLVAINLSRTKVTDKGLESLATVRNLNVLRLSGTNITDESLDALKGRKPSAPAMMLDVTDTAITEERVKTLFAEHNQWNIVYGSSKNPETTWPPKRR